MCKHLIILSILFLPKGLFGAIQRYRWVAASPQVTEAVFALGKQRDLVGVSEGSQYPAAASRLPSIGNWFQLNLEKILQPLPTGVLWDSGITIPDWSSRLRMTSFTFQFSSPKALRESAARFLAQFYGEALPPALSEESFSPLPPFTFLLVLCWDPLLLASQRTFLSAALEERGGSNLLQSRVAYPQVSKEWLYLHPPQVLFLLDTPPPPAKWRRHLPATRVIPLPADPFSRGTFAIATHLSRMLR